MSRFRALTIPALIAVVAIAATAQTTGYADTMSAEGDAPTLAVVHSGHFHSPSEQILAPNTPPTWVGFFADIHKYPGDNRVLMIDDPSGKGMRFVHLNEGGWIGIDALLGYHLSTTNVAAALAFDRMYGDKWYGSDYDTLPHRVWDGPIGWDCFLHSHLLWVIAETVSKEVSPISTTKPLMPDEPLRTRINTAVNEAIRATTAGFFADVDFEIQFIDPSHMN